MHSSALRTSCGAALMILILGCSYSWASDPPLKLVISKVHGARYSSHSIPINVVLINATEQRLRLLDVFEQQKRLIPFFSWFEIRSADGTYVPVQAGGKIDLARSDEHYVELRKNQKYRLTVNLSDYVKQERNLAGPYTVSVKYANQYGRDCFQGQVKGKPIEIDVHTE